MDKITHQVRAEHWTKIMNECINSGMSKTAWCRANGIPVKQFFYWQRILRREAFENPLTSSLPTAAGSDPSLVPATQRTVFITGNCRTASGNGADSASGSKGGLFYGDQTSIFFSEHRYGFPSGSRDPKRQSHPGDFEFCIG